MSKIRLLCLKYQFNERPPSVMNVNSVAGVDCTVK